jgi:hypothetical protein
MNLLELVQAQLSDERLTRLASIVGESSVGTRKALSGAALPAVLAGLSSEFAGEAGASRLLDLMRAGGHDGSILASLDGALAGGAHTDALLNLGKGQLGAILGDRVDAVSELMAADTGIRRPSAVALLGLIVPVVLGVLGKQLQAGGGAGRIAELLAGARPALAAMAAPGLSAALGVANLGAAAATGTVGAQREGAVWPWLIVPAVALGMFFSLRSCQQNSMRAPSTPVGTEASSGAPQAATAGTADAAELPATAPVSSSEAMVIDGATTTTSAPEAGTAAAPGVPAAAAAPATGAASTATPPQP